MCKSLASVPVKRSTVAAGILKLVLLSGSPSCLGPHLSREKCMRIYRNFQREWRSGPNERELELWRVCCIYFQVTLPNPRTLAHKPSFIPRTSQLWNTLPFTTFSEFYSLSSFKSSINKLDLTFLYT